MYYICPITIPETTLPYIGKVYLTTCRYQDGREQKIFKILSQAIEWLKWTAKSYNGVDITIDDIIVTNTSNINQLSETVLKLVEDEITKIKNGAVTIIHSDKYSNLNEVTEKQKEDTTTTDKQVGGNHYRKTKGEQHWDRLIRLYGFDKAKYYFMGSITKYIERHEDKNGLQDLEKAYHFLGKMIVEYKINEENKKKKEDTK